MDIDWLVNLAMSVLNMLIPFATIIVIGYVIYRFYKMFISKEK